MTIEMLTLPDGESLLEAVVITTRGLRPITSVINDVIVYGPLDPWVDGPPPA